MQNILEVCGEEGAVATEYLAMLLRRRGTVRGARAQPRVRAQLLRHLLEAFWTLHFDGAHPMQRRMIVVPLAGARVDFHADLTLLRVVQPKMLAGLPPPGGVVVGAGGAAAAAADGDDYCTARSAAASPLINPGTRAITLGESSGAGPQGPAVQDGGSFFRQSGGGMAAQSVDGAQSRNPQRRVLVYHDTAAHLHRERMGRWLLDSADVRPYTSSAGLGSAKQLVRRFRGVVGGYTCTYAGKSGRSVVSC